MAGGVAYLTIDDVSGYLKVPRETLYKLVRSGRIPASKVGRHWRFARGEIDHWLSQQRDRRSPPRLKVLVVDDEYAVQKIMSRWLNEANCNVETASGGHEALDKVTQSHFDLILLDLMMPAMNGVDTLREIKNISPTSIVVIATGYFDSQMMDAALELGPLMAIKKPVAHQAIITLVNSLVTCGKNYNLGHT